MLKKIEAFTGLQSCLWSKNETQPHFTGNYRETMSGEAGAILTEFYRDQVNQLRTIPGLDLPWASSTSLQEETAAGGKPGEARPELRKGSRGIPSKETLILSLFGIHKLLETFSLDDSLAGWCM